jgi:hypothetical protein
MASSSTGFSYQSFDVINGRWIIPASIISDSEFNLLWTAYEGRNKVRFQRRERGSRTNIHLDLFLKLVTKQIKSTNPFATLSQAITFYKRCNAIKEQDFDLLKRISEFLLEYGLLSASHHSSLRDEISLRIPAKRAAETVRLVKARKDAEEALARRKAEEEEEERFWNSPAVAEEVARAESAHQVAPLSQELVVLTGPSEPGVPPIEL